MATGKITKRSVDGLPSASRDQFLWDDELRGFGLKVTPAGARSYVFQYRLGGRESKTRRYSIGKHGSPWTPSLAREEAGRLAILVAQGIDPLAAKNERRRLTVDLEFAAYASTFLANCKGTGWRGLVERTLRLHVTPALKDRALPDITRAHVSAVLDRIPADQRALKRNTFAVVRRLFRWAVSRGDVTRSPCEGMETPAAVTARDRVLSDDEVASVWRACGQVKGHFGTIVRLLIATGQRREEVTGMTWSELDRASATWTLPKERSKNGVAHLVPLSTLALEIIQSVAPTQGWPSTGFVFGTSGKKAFQAHHRGKINLDEALAEAKASNEATSRTGRTALPWRLHDLRHTFATGLQRLGIRFEVTEATLNHLSGARSGVAAVYQRYEWKDEKRAAMEVWSNHVRAVVASIARETA